MSLLDMILGQKLILLSLAVSVAPLLAAMSILLVSRLKRQQAHRQRERSRRVLMLQQQQQAAAATSLPNENAVPVQPGQPPVRTDSALLAEQSSEEQLEEQQPQGEVASAVQDILSSVFTEGEDSDRYAALLETIEEIDVSQLATMCSQVGDQLRIGQSPVSEAKEA
jgi:hypothetical protein